MNYFLNLYLTLHITNFYINLTPRLKVSIKKNFSVPLSLANEVFTTNLCVEIFLSIKVIRLLVKYCEIFIVSVAKKFHQISSFYRSFCRIFLDDSEYV